MWMRGGTSKGGYFLADDLPADTAERDAFLLRVMGSPDPRQIDGMGGADPLTSKVAVVQQDRRATGVDVDYLFLQVFVDQAIVTDAQNCGNILAGIGPFAIERGLVAAQDGETRVAIFMENTGQVAIATVADAGRHGRPMPATRASTACPAPPRRSRSRFATRPARPAARCCRPAMRVDEIDGVALHADRQRHAVRRASRPPISASPATRTATTLEADAALQARRSRRSG